MSFIAQKICNELARPFYIEKNTIKISSSIGIAIYPEHGTNKKDLVANADKALYRVKNRNRNSFEFFAFDNKYFFMLLKILMIISSKVIIKRIMMN